MEHEPSNDKKDQEPALLTAATFGPDNRTKYVGRSIYRICNTDATKGSGKWYIFEIYSDYNEWAQGEGFYRNSLEEVIDIFNMIADEKAVISKYLSQKMHDTPMSVDEAYDYYWHTYEKGIFSLLHLQIKHRDGEAERSNWEKYREKSMYTERDFATYDNMQKALKRVIKDIQQSKFRMNPLPETIHALDFAMEEKKLTVVHRTLLCTCRKHPLGCGDSFYHNIRAALISRIEQLSNHELIVDFQGENGSQNPDDVIKIRDRKEYLKEKYGSCKSSLCLACNKSDCKEKINF